MIGRYKGHEWKLQRICDVISVKSHAMWYFLYDNGEPTGDHFATKRELMRYVDAMPAVKETP